MTKPMKNALIACTAFAVLSAACMAESDETDAPLGDDDTFPDTEPLDESDLPPVIEDLSSNEGYESVQDPEILAAEAAAVAAGERADAAYDPADDARNVLRSIYDYIFNPGNNTIIEIGIHTCYACVGTVSTYTSSGGIYTGTSDNLSKVFHGSYHLAPGYSPADVRGIAITGDFKYFVWYSDGKVSAGNTEFYLYTFRMPYDYAKPNGFSYSQLQAVAISASDRCYYYWLKNGNLYRTIGTSDNPTYYSGPTQVNNRPHAIRGLAIAKNSDDVYTWWADGFVGHGNSFSLW